MTVVNKLPCVCCLEVVCQKRFHNDGLRAKLGVYCQWRVFQSDFCQYWETLLKHICLTTVSVTTCIVAARWTGSRILWNDRLSVKGQLIFFHRSPSLLSYRLRLLEMLLLPRTGHRTKTAFKVNFSVKWTDTRLFSRDNIMSNCNGDRAAE